MNGAGLAILGLVAVGAGTFALKSRADVPSQPATGADPVRFLGPPVQAGGKLSPAQIADLASRAGFSGDDLAVAVAVALAESRGGDPNAYNPELQVGTPEGLGSYGLWQIYLFKHPEFSGSNLYDPQTNANAAFSVYQNAGFSFSPWTTFTSGDYISRLNSAFEVVG